MTVFKKIKSMSEDEMEEFLNNWCKEQDCESCPLQNREVCINYPYAYDFLESEWA